VLTRLLTLAALGLLWLLHWLPLPLIRKVGVLFGALTFYGARHRRHVAETNLRLCFPHLDEPARTDLLRRNFRAFAQALLDRSLLWWAGEKRLRRLIRVRGAEHLDDGSGRPTILLTPHFVGMDACGLRISMDRQTAVIYSNQSNPLINAVMRKGRARFHDTVLMSRQDGLRKAIKSLREGLPFFYAADMDFGAKDAVFVPFFGVSAATVVGLPRLVSLTQARVIPLVSHLTPDGYLAELLPAWTDFPSGDMDADLRRLNSFIEQEVLKMPDQYFWLHKRFKTRPPGESKVY
jgi:Kdo2-lipid IVA lauroyltransferase/acyltransferase